MSELESAYAELYDFVATLENDDGKIPGWLWERRNDLLGRIPRPKRTALEKNHAPE